MPASAYPIPPGIDRVLFDEDAIARRVAELGAQLTAVYAGQPLTVVTILQGGALFMADLIRRIHLPLHIECISVSSYHGGTTSSGTVTFHQSRLPQVEGRHVLLVDDVLDTGRTLHAIREKLAAECRPRSLSLAVLLSKRISRPVPIEAEYVGFPIGGEFVVGYGLDYAGDYRNLPFVGTLSPSAIASASVPASPLPP